MIENLTDISVEQLLTEAHNMLFDDYRFITATCVDNGDETLDVIYHFDKDLEMKNFKIRVQKGAEVPSISKIYFCALLVENEMKELFGINITNIAIDYGGHMLLSDDDLESPMLRQQITIERKGDK
ncbi:respiratory-subunit NADH dehydrogenase subunit [Anaerobacterium chartisolvens]|uniref:Respiratory-subunit NADH dehydrogenase subunit n=1 Tax=Anaerobacterium chartisolvens TaxID=1297424 RepID=A0A369ATE5_9FIRM|nr:NADH-quinone oxidoreductase subunit C [Anaerobacterium chartisolvens]RCX12355.1 respiratory-subunit NADH dehydrogenase subunit [Anaerobacterium chartisolvens]